MRSLDEDIALSIIFANTRRKKRRESLITVANAFEHLIQLYGSQKAVAETVGLHPEMIREFRKLLELPEPVKGLVSSRQIDRLDVAYRISMLRDPARQIAAAKGIANLPSSKDVRDILRLAENANLPLEESKKMILDAKPKDLHIFVIDFNDETYEAIMRQAKDSNIDPAELVKNIVTDWLQRKSRAVGE